MSDVLLRHSPHYFLRQILSQNLELSNKPRRAGQQDPGSSHLCLSNAGITDACHHRWLLCAVENPTGFLTLVRQALHPLGHHLPSPSPAFFSEVADGCFWANSSSELRLPHRQH